MSHRFIYLHDFISKWADGGFYFYVGNRVGNKTTWAIYTDPRASDFFGSKVVHKIMPRLGDIGDSVDNGIFSFGCLTLINKSHIAYVPVKIDCSIPESKTIVIQIVTDKNLIKKLDEYKV